MEPNFQHQLDEQTLKLDAILNSVKKTERYFKVTMWITIVVFVLPLVVSVFIIPSIIRSYTEAMSTLM